MKSRRFIQNLERIANMTQRRGQARLPLKILDLSVPCPALFLAVYHGIEFCRADWIGRDRPVE
jgi:hypothetical protein